MYNRLIERGINMKSIGNLIWFIFGGFWQGMSWCIIGLLWCLSIIGIPVGIQCFKLSRFSFFPFGKEVEYGSSISIVPNILWIIFGGIPLAISALVNGLFLCITIIGIPFGLQCFKFAKLALMPFGTRVYKTYY